MCYRAALVRGVTIKKKGKMSQENIILPRSALLTGPPRRDQDSAAALQRLKLTVFSTASSHSGMSLRSSFHPKLCLNIYACPQPFAEGPRDSLSGTFISSIFELLVFTATT